MKTKLFFSALFSFFFCLLSSQIPQGFNYQAIAKDGSGNPIAGQSLPVRISIQSDTLGGTIFWVELHSGIMTNSQGLFNIVVGKGARQSGTIATFSAIDWSVTPKYIMTEVNYGGWKTLGSSKLWSVPYAMNSKVSDQWMTSGSNIYRLTGNVGIGTNNPQVPLSVYNPGSNTTIHLGNSAVGQTFLSMGTSASTNGYSYLQSIKTSGSAYGNLILNNSGGNVGIGTSNPTSKVVVQPDAAWDDNIPLFEVKNKLGIPVLAVYNNGVRILVDHTIAKSPKGGFAVSGYDFTKAGKTVDLMTISPDSIRFNINNDNAKVVKGGFAVGGFDVNSKGPINQDFMYITPQTSNSGQYNTFLGYQAGFNNQISGLYNSFIGYNAGYGNTIGGYNVLIGYKAGSNTTNAHYNTSIGFEAGQNTVAITDLAREGSSNVFMGYQAGKNVTTGMRSVLIGMIAGLNWKVGEGNVFIGYSAGSGELDGSPGDVTGTNNTFIGNGAGMRILTGDENVFVGAGAGVENRYGARNVLLGGHVNYSAAGYRGTTLNDNVYIGYSAAGANSTGINNVMIGSGSGNSNNGSSNVFIGYQAGSSLTGSNKLFIANTSGATPLIGGSFSPTPMVGINRMPTTYTLEVGGTIWANGAAITSGNSTWSDARYKTNIVPLTGALNDILNLQGIKFNWKDSDYPDLNFPEGEQIGVLAQEVEKVLPQLVSTGPDGYKSVSYEKFTPVLIEAIKEQQRQIESTKEENQKLRSELDTIRKEIEQLKEIIR